MILVVNLCKEKMHELEFVKPVCDVLERMGNDYSVRHYLRLKKGDLDAEKIILCGTSLRDFGYLKHLRMFDWLRDYQGDVLGICGGAQILVQISGGSVFRSQEIGKVLVKRKEEFLGFPEEFFVYGLHNLGIKSPEGFQVVASSSEGAQIILRKEKNRGRLLLGVLFHPEVLNPFFIENFCKQRHEV